LKSKLNSSRRGRSDSVVASNPAAATSRWWLRLDD
jgi:hypothetical protein